MSGVGQKRKQEQSTAGASASEHDHEHKHKHDHEHEHEHAHEHGGRAHSHYKPRPIDLKAARQLIEVGKDAMVEELFDEAKTFFSQAIVKYGFPSEEEILDNSAVAVEAAPHAPKEIWEAFECRARCAHETAAFSDVVVDTGRAFFFANQLDEAAYQAIEKEKKAAKAEERKQKMSDTGEEEDEDDEEEEVETLAERLGVLHYYRGMALANLGASEASLVEMEKAKTLCGALAASANQIVKTIQVDLANYSPDTIAKEMAERKEKEAAQVPVTILTGFLGAGKTTLLNHILEQKHGQKIAVIENEFGQVGVDDQIVKKEFTVENLVELNAGCICCTVRGDLVKGVTSLMEQRELDGIIIETTGLANPAPVIQTFYVDPVVSAKARVDGVITVVDSKHVGFHLLEEEKKIVESMDKEMDAFDRAALAAAEARAEQERRLAAIVTEASEEPQLKKTKTDATESTAATVATADEKSEKGTKSECHQQIAFADVIILNKMDLLGNTPAEQEQKAVEVEKLVRRVNAFAKIIRATNSAVDVSQVMGISAFSLDHVLKEVDSGFLDDKTHGHDEAVSSFSVKLSRPLQRDEFAKFIDWVSSDLGQTNIYRLKGIVAFEHDNSKHAIQGVHNLVRNTIVGKWNPGEERRCHMVFIGKEMGAMEETIRQELERCMSRDVDLSQYDKSALPPAKGHSHSH